jgi:hypothetical protein
MCIQSHAPGRARSPAAQGAWQTLSARSLPFYCSKMMSAHLHEEVGGTPLTPSAARQPHPPTHARPYSLPVEMQQYLHSDSGPSDPADAICPARVSPTSPCQALQPACGIISTATGGPATPPTQSAPRESHPSTHARPNTAYRLPSALSPQRRWAQRS